MNYSTSSQNHALNHSASDSFCSEKGDPWKLRCFNSSGGEGGALLTLSSSGAPRGVPRGKKT